MKGTSFRSWAPIAASNLLELDAVLEHGNFFKNSVFLQSAFNLGPKLIDVSARVGCNVS